MCYRLGKGVRNSCNSRLLQLLRILRSTSRGMLIFVCVIASPDGATTGNEVIS